jgi:hypothetical protein
MQEITFDGLLDTIDALPVERQKDLVDVLQQRLKEYRREEIARNAIEAEALFDAGRLAVGTVDDFLAEFESEIA